MTRGDLTATRVPSTFAHGFLHPLHGHGFVDVRHVRGV